MTRGKNAALVALAAVAGIVGVRAQPKTAMRMIQTSSAGTTVCVIDPASNKVVGVVHGLEVNRAVAASLDGSRLFITGQYDSELGVVDARTFEVVKRVPLDGHPDYISIGKDGRHLYVGLDSSAVEVIDVATLQKVKSIAVRGAVHYAYVTPDGKYVVTASVGGRNMAFINTSTEEVESTLQLQEGVRPIAFETAKDGSTTRMFVELSNLHGFAVFDFATHKELTRITFPDIPGKMKNVDGIQEAPAHGIAITPDGKMLWATSKWYGYAYAYSLPDLKYLGGVDIGLGPEWLNFTPDGKRVYISLAGRDEVAVVDVQQMKLLERIPVGYVPKANTMAMLQTN